MNQNTTGRIGGLDVNNVNFGEYANLFTNLPSGFWGLAGPIMAGYIAKGYDATMVVDHTLQTIVPFLDRLNQIGGALAQARVA